MVNETLRLPDARCKLGCLDCHSSSPEQQRPALIKRVAWRAGARLGVGFVDADAPWGDANL